MRAPIGSGEKYPEWGILHRRRVTRWVADKRRFGNPGNGMPSKSKVRRRGADPPKKESGMTGAVSPVEWSRRYVNSGNGTCIAAKTCSNCQFEREKRETTYCTRLLCPSAARMLSVPDEKGVLLSTMRGKAGQTSNLSLAGVSGVQTSRRFKQRGDRRIRLLHRRHK